MKLLIASDIHGDIACAKELFDIFDRERCDRLLLLGDLLYHGPRNDLPSGYAPKAVIELLNSRKESILAVRGNCDTEVDQMVLEFPILAEYIFLSLDGLSIIATHGHNINKESAFPFRSGDILLHGHTHILATESFGDNCVYLNPGSISLPKCETPRSYMIYVERAFKIYDFDNSLIESVVF